MTSIPETEWRKIRDMKQAVLDRACKRILHDLATAASQTIDDAQDHHEQYLRVYKMLLDRDNDIAQGFNDFRRSNAYFLLANWVGKQWLTLAEFNKLSKETRAKALLICGIDEYNPVED